MPDATSAGSVSEEGRGLARKRQAAILTIAPVLVWTVCALLLRTPLYDGFALLASVTILVATIAFYKWQPPEGREGYRLLGFFVCGQTFISAGLSVISEVDDDPLRVTPTSDAFSFSVEAAVIFSIMFALGAWFTAPGPGERLADAPTKTSGPTPVAATLIAVCTVLLSLALISSSAARVTPLGTLPLLLINVGLLVPMLVASRVYRSSFPRLPLFIAIAGQALATFYTSMLGVLLFSVRDIILAQIYLRKRISTSLLILAAVFLIVINPAKQVFRTLVGQNADAGTSTFEEASTNWQEAITTTWSTDRRGPDRRLEATSSRLNYNWLSAHVYANVPSRMPYQMGATFEDIPAIMVPRLLYPDKPTSSGYYRSRWLVQLGLQDSRTVETVAISLPAPAEAYWNFGWSGVFGVPVVLGLLAGAMLRIAPRDPVARVGFVVVLATMLGQFLDMLVWIIPQFIVVGVAAIVATVYCRIGRIVVSSRTAKLPRNSKIESVARP
jgi:hypothetical protein